ncbi:MAG TPA: hypothetical protein VMY77_14240 [Chitinophagaceae bacterium]|nr:hypothetical protein [Chitinophagaceae bacterium]
MKTKIFLFCAIVAVLFTSCQKDTDIFIPDTTSVGLDTNWVASINPQSPISEVKRLLSRENFLDSIDATAGGTLHTSDGLTVIILPSSLQFSTGQLATGKIHIETMIVKQRGDMVRLDKPTTSFGRVLISGGEIFVKITKENQELQLAPGKGIYIKYTDPFPTRLMRLFYGDESNPERFNWVPVNNQTGNSGVDTISNPSGYALFSTQLRWINCDYFADSSGGRVNVTASLPADYTNANTSVYLVFKEIRSVVGMYGDITTKRFSSPKVPSGKVAVVISITKKGTNSYYLGQETITIGQTSLNGIQSVPLKPQPTSLTDIKAYLSTL